VEVTIQMFRADPNAVIGMGRAASAFVKESFSPGREERDIVEFWKSLELRETRRTSTNVHPEPLGLQTGRVSGWPRELVQKWGKAGSRDQRFGPSLMYEKDVVDWKNDITVYKFFGKKHDEVLLEDMEMIRNQWDDIGAKHDAVNRQRRRGSLA
jgi:hypothetical protein